MPTKKEKRCSDSDCKKRVYCHDASCGCNCHSKSESIEWEQYCTSNDEAYNDIDPKIRGMLSRSDLKHFVNGWNTFVKTKLSKVITNAVANRNQSIKEMLENELLIKCECEDGDCENCKRLLGVIDSL